jgi:glucose/arabinose dehydrogenase
MSALALAGAWLSGCGRDELLLELGSGVGGAAGDGGTGGAVIEVKEPLQLEFEALSHEAPLPFVTDMEFAPGGSSEFIMVDLTGGFAHMRLEGEHASLLTEGRIDDVYIDGAAGLVGVAIDPDFAENGFFYMVMAVTKQKNVLRRYTLFEGDGMATLDSMVPIFEIDTPRAPRWHNITSIGFEPGRAGVMWLTVGEKGMFEPAQDPANRLGSLMRIIPSRNSDEGGYTTPGDVEPYSEDADPAVFAKGLRSPWRAVLHDNKWYFGDVGLGDIEEINIIDGPRQNFGWPLVEGPCALDLRGEAPSDCAERFVDPWLYYNRSNSHRFVAEDFDAVPTNKRSVYVGWIYQENANDRYDGRWNDVMTFGDTYVGFLRGKRIDKPNEDWAIGHIQWATAWAQGPDGYVYVMALDDFPIPEDDSALPSPLWRAVLAP